MDSISGISQEDAGLVLKYSPFQSHLPSARFKASSSAFVKAILIMLPDEHCIHRRIQYFQPDQKKKESGNPYKMVKISGEQIFEY